jgi:hypothetical protein
MNCLTTKYDTVFIRTQFRDLRAFHNLSCSSLSHILHKAALSNFISFFSVRSVYIQVHKQRYLITNPSICLPDLPKLKHTSKIP